MEGTYELPEETKAHLKAEEIFRLAVRRELEAKEPISSRGSRVWHILNSFFVLWFLSSVVVAILAALVSKYEARRAERIRQAETIRRLDTEIADRLFVLRTSLCLDLTEIANGPPVTPKTIYNAAAHYLDNTMVEPHSTTLIDFGVYPEYKTRTFRSLLYELGTITDSPEVPLVKELLVDNEKIQDLTETASVDRDKSSKTLEDLLRKVNKYLAEDRWRRRSMASATGECGY